MVVGSFLEGRPAKEKQGGVDSSCYRLPNTVASPSTTSLARSSIERSRGSSCLSFPVSISCIDTEQTMSSTTPSSGSHLGGHPPHPLDAVDSSDTYAVAFNQEQAAAASLPLRLSARNLHGTAVLPLPRGPGNPSSNNNDIAGAHSLSSPYYYPSASAGSYHPSASPPANNEEEEDGDDLASLCSVGTDLEAAGANSHHNPRGGGGNGDKQVVLGRTETRRVRCLRVLVLLILVAAAALCATFVYKYTSADEADNFQVVYQQYSQLVVDTVHRNAQHKLEAVGALVAMVQSYAISSNSTWPFVTVPFFEEHVLVSRSLTDAYGVVLYPIVTDANKEEWEDYSVAHRGWINASYDAQRDTFGEDQGRWPMPNQTWFDALWGDKYRNPNNPNFSSGIGVPIFKTTQPNNPDWHIPVVETFPGPYFPQWQAASMGWYYHMTVNSNYAQFPDFLESTRLVIDTQTAVLGMPWTDPSAPGYISTLLFPVLDAFHGTNKTVTAFLGVDIFWEAYLSRILPPNATGLHVVIESSFGDVFTFELEGDQAVFLGDGDLHETAFNSWAVPTQFGQYVQEASKSDTYTGVPLYDGFYQYNFTIYPSAELQSQYVTNQPVVFTVAILAVFVFTSLVFVAYDCLVERRQKVVLTTAVRSDAIVSSLFPSGVKERLYEQHELQQQQQQQQQPQTFAADDAGHFTQRADEDRTSEWLGLPNPQVTAKEGPPIAELYPHATVLFAGTF